MYKITHFQKYLNIDVKKPYGAITVYFGSKDSFKKFRPLSMSKFITLSHILENDEVGYDPETKMFSTPVEKSKYVEAPKREIK
ncbi:hypothetical protein EZY14_004175 [Kordia sp. TARA_039_SRF]|nr:hypothetical protein EZY14_004175 [Kordia sp. TARA_039_SRF]